MDPHQSSDEPVGDDTADQLQSKNEQEPEDRIRDADDSVKPKGAPRTTFYGVKKSQIEKGHKRKQNYKCLVCEISYPNQSLLNSHYKENHAPPHHV